MDLPRIASHTSLLAPNIELLNYNHNIDNNSDEDTLLKEPRKSASKRLLSITNSNQSNNNVKEYNIPVNIPQISILPGTLPLSRKREEACALQNLKKRVQQLRIVKANEQFSNESAVGAVPKESPETDNKPLLFQRKLVQRPVSMVLDREELQTAWQDSDFITDCLCWHNVYRQRHGSEPLTMSPELCDYAQTWANHLAHTNTFYYRIDKDVGQNLFCRPTNALQSDFTGQEVASYWYGAVRQYDFDKESDVLHANVNAGHFTQLVWASSRRFGVGKARSRSGKVIVVAYYSPPGNTSGGFQENVLPPMPENLVLQVPQVYGSESDSESRSSRTNSTR